MGEDLVHVHSAVTAASQSVSVDSTYSAGSRRNSDHRPCERMRTLMNAMSLLRHAIKVVKVTSGLLKLRTRLTEIRSAN